MYPAGDVGVVEGEMNIPTRGLPSGDSMEFNTLDEPIKETFVSIQTNQQRSFISCAWLCL